MNTPTPREAVEEVCNRLFYYTDEQDWQLLQNMVFTKTVWFDMRSMGGTIGDKSAKDICAEWKAGFAGIDAINHLSGNYLITVNDGIAGAFCYATATHYKASATNGKTREFVGTYDLGLINTDAGWRINSFGYTLKYATGNLDLT